MSLDPDLYVTEAVFCWGQPTHDDRKARVELGGKLVGYFLENDACVCSGPVALGAGPCSGIELVEFGTVDVLYKARNVAANVTAREVVEEEGFRVW